MSRPLSCPACGASTLGDHTFTAMLPTRGSWTAVIHEVSDDGKLMLEGVHHHAEPCTATIELRCDNCRHEFYSRRAWVHDHERESE